MSEEKRGNPNYSSREEEIKAAWSKRLSELRMDDLPAYLNDDAYITARVNFEAGYLAAIEKAPTLRLRTPEVVSQIFLHLDMLDHLEKHGPNDRLVSEMMKSDQRLSGVDQRRTLLNYIEELHRELGMSPSEVTLTASDRDEQGQTKEVDTRGDET
jgi:hypothetical protein